MMEAITRPKRLIAITILDGLVGAMALVAAGYIAVHPEIFRELELSTFDYALAFASPLMLLAACIWALSGQRHGGMVLLSVAVPYFG